MSANIIIQSISKLTEVHRELLKTAKEKTEAIKSGIPDELQAVLLAERKIIKKAEQAESERQEAAESWFKHNKLPVNDMSVSKMLGLLREKEKHALAVGTEELTEVIAELRQQERLNQDLIRQSMEFVQLSLELVNPSMKKMNYGSQKQQQTTTNHSLFDSQA
ncbi:flagellar protein FlgN [Virgibacillus sediminis]|uniref:Flagellar protein FlgN n=1 Tax=Virgibacillus sediminis TaxID=202260 RepID=A0ABV7A2I0_9BACI